MKDTLIALRDIFVASVLTKVGTESSDIMIVPPGYQTTPLIGPKYQRIPKRIEEVVNVGTLGAFVAYYNRFALENSIVFCDSANSKITGVIDYSDAESPRWGLHRVEYDYPKSEEWKVWTEHNKKNMSQAGFAEFIENNIDEIVEPAGAQMLEIARTLQAKTGVEFRSAIRLDNGERQFTYKEEINGQAGVTGTLKVPEEFKLGLRVFKEGDAYGMRARFRYRLNQGSVVMWYELVYPDRVYDDAIKAVVEKLTKEVKAGLVINGQAPNLP